MDHRKEEAEQRAEYIFDQERKRQFWSGIITRTVFVTGAVMAVFGIYVYATFNRVPNAIRTIKSAYSDMYAGKYPEGTEAEARAVQDLKDAAGTLTGKDIELLEALWQMARKDRNQAVLSREEEEAVRKMAEELIENYKYRKYPGIEKLEREIGKI